MNPDARSPSRPGNDAGGQSRRWQVVLGVTAFVALYRWAYIHFMATTYTSYGFDFQPVPTLFEALAWLFAIVPSLWMPIRFTRASQLAYWILYLTVVVPSMFIPLFIGLNPPNEILPFMATLCASFGLLGLGYRFRLHAFPASTIGATTFWMGFAIFGTACTLALVISFWGNMHLVSFADIYDVRQNSQDTGGALLNYALMWSYGATYPFLIAWGLYYKKPWLFVLGSLGQVLVYACFGTKASLLSIVFIAGLCGLFRVGRGPFPLKLLWAINAVFLVLCLIFRIEDETPDLLTLALMFLVMFRSFGLSGLLSGQYFYFFQHNPHTYFSHLKVVNWIVHYPYHYPLGTEIGYYYYGAARVDTTAHFWATDGLAALGLPGIVVASLACAFLFWLIDSTTARHDIRLTGLVTFYATYSLANLSLFTTFISGGLGLLIFFLWALPAREDRSMIPVPASRARSAVPNTGAPGRELSSRHA